MFSALTQTMGRKGLLNTLRRHLQVSENFTSPRTEALAIKLSATKGNGNCYTLPPASAFCLLGRRYRPETSGVRSRVLGSIAPVVTGIRLVVPSIPGWYAEWFVAQDKDQVSWSFHQPVIRPALRPVHPHSTRDVIKRKVAATLCVRIAQAKSKHMSKCFDMETCRKGHER